MFKLIVYFNIILIILGQNDEYIFEESDSVITPFELVLRSNDTEGFFYCYSKTKERSEITALVENSMKISPTFIMKTTKINATVLRIRIQPNGYIGMNRITCRWDNNYTYDQTADLIIGDNPGLIQLKERCVAYDRRYIQCILRAPIIARAFLNGFPRLFQFIEIRPESMPTVYRTPAILARISNESELVFHFEPRDRMNIPKKISMKTLITLRRFNSSIYYFNIEPLHITIVNYTIEAISSTGLTIHIHHNNTGTINPRICFGRVSQIDNKNRWLLIQDINETTEQQIFITQLRSSENYEICLRCFYEHTDHSAKEQVCIRIKTKGWNFRFNLFGFMIIIIILILIISMIGVILFHRKRISDLLFTKINSKSSPNNVNTPECIGESEPHYLSEPIVFQENASLLDESVADDNDNSELENGKYLMIDTMEMTIQDLTDRSKVSPDTVDLRKNVNNTQ